MPCSSRTGHIERDRRAEQQMLSAVLDQRARVEIPGRIVLGGQDDPAVLVDLAPLRRGEPRPQQLLGEIGRAGDADQRRRSARGRASAASSMIQPLMLEPTRICGPSVSESMTAIASSRQRPIVPEREIAARRAVAEIVEAHIGAPAPAAIILQKQGLGAGHVGAEAAEEDDPRARSRRGGGRRLWRRPGVLGLPGYPASEAGRAGALSGAGIEASAAGRMTRRNDSIPAGSAEGRPPAVLQVIPEPRLGRRRARHGRSRRGARRGRMDRLCRLVRRPDGAPAGARRGASHQAAARLEKPAGHAAQRRRAERDHPAGTGSTSCTRAAAPRRGARWWAARATAAPLRDDISQRLRHRPAAEALVQFGDGARRAGHRDLAIRRRARRQRPTASARTGCGSSRAASISRHSIRIGCGASGSRRWREQWRVPDDAKVVMLPGRLTRWKGGLDFIEAIARLGRRDLCCSAGRRRAARRLPPRTRSGDRAARARRPVPHRRRLPRHAGRLHAVRCRRLGLDRPRGVRPRHRRGAGDGPAGRRDRPRRRARDDPAGRHRLARARRATRRRWRDGDRRGAGARCRRSAPPSRGARSRISLPATPASRCAPARSTVYEELLFPQPATAGGASRSGELLAVPA